VRETKPINNTKYKKPSQRLENEMVEGKTTSAKPGAVENEREHRLAH
jgi:hypothetical protein